MTRTQSETWFEAFCTDNGIPFERIETGARRSPDYDLDLDGQQVIVEVKEILPNKQERASLEKLRRDGVGLVDRGKPGERIRQKIEVASGQIKARTNGQLPSLLVVCDIKHGCGQIAGHAEAYQVRVAMEGFDQVVFAMPSDRSESPYAVGMRSGPRKKMTATDNTSISAVGVLHTPPGEPISLVVYHNRYAAVPLSTETWKKLNVPQFRLAADAVGGPSVWQTV